MIQLDWGLVVQGAVTLSGAVAAYLLLRTKLYKDTQEAAVELSDLRGQRIDDLEAEVARLRAREAAHNVECKVMIEQLRVKRTQEIAERIIGHLNDHFKINKKE